MSTFPSVSGAQLIKALRKLGFEVIRIKGSHHFLQHSDTRCIFVHRFSQVARNMHAAIDLTSVEVRI